MPYWSLGCTTDLTGKFTVGDSNAFLDILGENILQLSASPKSEDHHLINVWFNSFNEKISAFQQEIGGMEQVK